MESVWKVMLARRAMRVGLVLAVAALLLQAQPGTARAYSPAYSCYGTHCYALTTWWGNTFGVWTNINVTLMGCGLFGCGFDTGLVDNETWLATSAGDCWVEAGYSTFTPFIADYTAYFWADQRSGSGYFEHDWGAVPDWDYGQDAHVVILSNGPESQQFNVWIWTDAGTSYFGLSTDNTMSANEITIGQELAGGGDAWASPTAFRFNASATSPFFFGFFQNTDGDVYTDNPPYDEWVIHPASSGSGGDFSTSCC